VDQRLFQTDPVANGAGPSGNEKPGRPTARLREPPLHPAWRSFLRFCRELGYGEIERLSIQDGLPVTAQVVKKKIRFGK